MLGGLPASLRAEVEAEAEALGMASAPGAPPPRGPDRAPPEVVQSPATAPELVRVAVLLDAIATALHRYMVLAAEQVCTLALWVVHTYALDAADFTPYLHIHSPERECGKSTLLDLLFVLVWRPRKSGGFSAAVLFRLIDKETPTLLLDELDTVFSGAGSQTETSEAIRQTLNSGFQRGLPVLRCVGDAHEVREFQVFGAKALAGIGTLPDTILSRSIPFRLDRASGAELRGLARLRGDRIADELAPIREALTAWAEAHVGALRAADPDVPAALGARTADIWRPLLAIADAAGGEWPARARAAAATLHGARAANDEPAPGARLLADVHEVFVAHGAGDGTPVDRLGSVVLLADLTGREDRPWGEWNRDRPMTARQLAKLLGNYGAKPAKLRVGATTPWGYYWADLAPAVARYAASAATPAPSLSAGTTGTPEHAAATLPSRSGVPVVPAPTGKAGGPRTSYP